MRPVIIILTCLIPLWLFACDSTTEPKKETTAFLFRVEVSDPAGKPVPGLRISGYNELTGIDPFLSKIFPPASGRLAPGVPGARLLQRPTFQPTAITIVPFVAAEKSHVNISMFDMKNDLITVLSDSVLNAGGYHLSWSTGRETPPGIYRCQMTAKDTLTGETIFEASMYPVNWTADPEVSIYGFTNSIGVFETTNDLLFPNVLGKLPKLIHTNEIADTVGTFEFEDTVVITLTDTSSGDTMRLRKVVKAGKNTFSIVWDPDPPENVRRYNQLARGWDLQYGQSRFINEQVRPYNQITTNRDIDPPDLEWRLEQNFPNPYN